ncbi:hypothetical protein SAY86_010400 [Trapa natans]|uniref:Uncharacterized protein n=1 Tax=Trapa natans TaxID=22666 RepID=A0AAN7LH20_TRANT|nr:hypothetical protein SAY86_010400 [Trapa natans]
MHKITRNKVGGVILKENIIHHEQLQGFFSSEQSPKSRMLLLASALPTPFSSSVACGWQESVLQSETTCHLLIGTSEKGRSSVLKEYSPVAKGCMELDDEALLQDYNTHQPWPMIDDRDPNLGP